MVGLGQIGMGYDYKLNDEKYILTHCQTINIHPDFELVGGVDISNENRIKMEMITFKKILDIVFEFLK